MQQLHRLGRGTVMLSNRPRIVAGAAIVGKKEGEGPLAASFDRIIEDDLFSEETWELTIRMYGSSRTASIRSGSETK